MSATTSVQFQRTSRRATVWLTIAAFHVVAIYVACTNAQVRAMFEPPPIMADIIEQQMPDEVSPPPPVPKLEAPTPPTIDPPVITLPEEPPAPTAITVAVSESPTPVASTPRMVTDVAYVQPPRPQYPPESRRSGEQGLVILRVLIDEAGHAVKIEVERSSGFARLDAAARRAVEGAQFRPYVENGVPRSALAVVPIEFTWKSHSAGNSRRS